MVIDTYLSYLSFMFEIKSFKEYEEIKYEQISALTAICFPAKNSSGKNDPKMRLWSDYVCLIVMEWI